MTVSTADWPITVVETATSSSDLARAAAADGAAEGTGFLVGTQTAGRGRRGRSWASGQGGMYYSVLLKPPFLPDRWFGLSFPQIETLPLSLIENLHGPNKNTHNPPTLGDSHRVCRDA